MMKLYTTPRVTLSNYQTGISQHLNYQKNKAQPFNALHFAGKADTLTLTPNGVPKQALLPQALHKTIEQAAAELYGKKQAPEVTKRVLAIIQEARSKRPAELVMDDHRRPTHWYKTEQAYMLYPDRFGTQDGKPTTFKQLIPMLDYLKQLGVTTVYVLPFMKSPMIDAGFDISDYKEVRPELGGNQEFEAFIAAARKQGLKIKADLVLNHVSDQHPWFQSALKGDPEKLDYFLHKDKTPNTTVKKTPKDGTWITYTENDGSLTKRRLIFPEISSTHYRKAEVNGKDKYFYYTFYPHQVDLNWKNPKVLYEALDIMAYWANKGIDIFRLDALPFFVKPPNTNGENTPGTHAVIQLLSASLQAISPRSVLWAEACQTPSALKRYFGDEQRYAIDLPPQGAKLMQRTNKVQLAYHFPQMTALWDTLITQNPKAFWQNHRNTPQLPESTEWASFFRLHDEMTMEMYNDPKRKALMQDVLSSRGEPFRGGEGIGGRLASFLDNDPKRIQLSQSILYSLPGLPLQYYGDEIGERNNREFMQQAAEERAIQATRSSANFKTALDARDIGRAPISRERLLNAMSQPDSREGRLFHHVKRLIEVRKQEPALREGNLTEIPADKSHIFSYLRQQNQSQVLLINNLSNEATATRLSLPAQLQGHTLGTKPIMNLQTDTPFPISKQPSKNKLEVTLAPYESLWLKLPESESPKQNWISGFLPNVITPLKNQLFNR
jgi:maltose alpha-D-glucosyltransferase/alpha-amylase